MDSRLLDILARHLRYATPGGLDLNRSLRDLGLDSMRAIELLFDVEATFDIVVPDELLNDETFATASSLWSAIELVRSSTPAAIPQGHS